MFRKQKNVICFLLTLVLMFSLSAPAFANGGQTYSVAFQLIGSGSAVTLSGDSEFSAGDTVTIVATARAGYQFYCWTNDGSVSIQNPYSYSTSFTMPANDVVITANFVADTAGGSGFSGATGTTNQYQVLFNSIGGSTVPTAYVAAGNTVSEPTAPTKEGFFFGGWYTDSGYTTKYDFSQPVTYTFTLYARWNESSSFTDVPKNAWFADAVFSVTKKSIMNGVSPTRFAPNATLTRAMVAQILANLSGATLYNYAYVPFSDVPATAWYYNAVAWAVETGVINGVSPTSFNPNAPVTRQDLAVMIYRYANNVSGVVLPRLVAPITFSDNAKIAAHARNAVAAMQQAQIIGGKANNRFDPLGHATRAEAAKMINQYILFEN